MLSMLATAALLAMSRDMEAANVVQNGNFLNTGVSGQLGYNVGVPFWTAGGKEGNLSNRNPVLVFSSGTGIEMTGLGVSGDGPLGLVKFNTATNSPGGGPVIAAAGDPDWLGSISQSISGLAVGTDYLLTFNWAGATQMNYSGVTTEKWQVSLGSDTPSTATITTPNESFIGWQSGSMTFTATAETETLNFQAAGTPAGTQTWLLLNNVQMSSVPVPEPNSMLMLSVGGAISAGLRRRRAV